MVYFSTDLGVLALLQDGTVITIAGSNYQGYSGDGGLASAATLSDPQSIAVDSRTRDVYIADSRNNVVRKVIAATGIIQSIAGTGVAGTCGGHGEASTHTCLSKPAGLHLHPTTGDLLIADLRNHRVLRLWADNATMTTVAGCGHAGFTPDGGSAAGGCLTLPYSASFGPTGDIYLVDANNTMVRRISAVNGLMHTVVGSGQPEIADCVGRTPIPALQLCLAGITNVVWDSLGNMIVSDVVNGRIYNVSRETQTAQHVAGLGYDACSMANSQNNGKPALTACLFPTWLSLYQDRIYMSDALYLQVRVVEPTTGIVFAVTAAQTNAGVCGDGGLATEACLGYPQSVVATSAGDVFIADATNNRVRLLNQSTGIITTYAGTGFGGYCGGDGGPANESCLFEPTALLLDASEQELYIADAFNYRIRKVFLSNGTIVTVAGNGSLFEGCRGPATEGLSATETCFGVIYSLAFDLDGNLLIPEPGQIRVLRADTGTVEQWAGTDAYGDTYASTGDFGPALEARFGGHLLIATDIWHRWLIVADFDYCALRVIDFDSGNVYHLMGDPSGTCAYSMDGDSAPSTALAGPIGLAVVPISGDILVADVTRVRKIDGTTLVVSTIAGSMRTLGFAGDGGPAMDAWLYNINGLTLDAHNNLLVCDAGTVCSSIDPFPPRDSNQSVLQATIACG